MSAMESQLLQRLKKLPPDRVAQVADFVEFLAAREERKDAARRLGESLSKLDAVNAPPVTEDEIEDAVQASRRARRQQAGDAPVLPPPQRP